MVVRRRGRRGRRGRRVPLLYQNSDCAGLEIVFNSMRRASL